MSAANQTPIQTPGQTPGQAPISAPDADPLDALLDELERRRESGEKTRIALYRQSTGGKMPLPEPDAAAWHPSDAARHGPGTYLVQLRGNRGSYVAQATFKIEAAGGGGDSQHNASGGVGRGAAGGAGAGVVGGLGAGAGGSFPFASPAPAQAGSEHGGAITPALMLQSMMSMQAQMMQAQTQVLTALISKDNGVKTSDLIQLAKGNSDVGQLVGALGKLRELAPESEGGGGGEGSGDLKAIAALLGPVLASAANQNNQVPRAIPARVPVARPMLQARAGREAAGLAPVGQGTTHPAGSSALPSRSPVGANVSGAGSAGTQAPTPRPDLPTLAAQVLAECYANGASAWFAAATVFEVSKEYGDDRATWAAALLESETTEVSALLAGIAPVFGASEDARDWSISAVDRLAEMFDDEYGDPEGSEDDDEVQQPGQVQGADGSGFDRADAERGNGGDPSGRGGAGPAQRGSARDDHSEHARVGRQSVGEAGGGGIVGLDHARVDGAEVGRATVDQLHDGGTGSGAGAARVGGGKPRSRKGRGGEGASGGG